MGGEGAPFLLSCMGELMLLLCAGLKEASEIVLYLKPLQILLEEMEQADFTVVRQPEKGRFAGAGRGLWGNRGAVMWAWGVSLPSPLEPWGGEG